MTEINVSKYNSSKTLKKIKNTLARTTPGPWGTVGDVVITVSDDPKILAECNQQTGQNVYNAIFIANAREDILWLIERVEFLEKELSKYQPYDNDQVVILKSRDNQELVVRNPALRQALRNADKLAVKLSQKLGEVDD